MELQLLGRSSSSNLLEPTYFQNYLKLIVRILNNKYLTMCEEVNVRNQRVENSFVMNSLRRGEMKFYFITADV